MDPLNCLATILGFCLNGFATVDASKVGSWPISVVTVAYDGAHISFVSTDNLSSPNREALPEVCDGAGAGCLHYAKACETGPSDSDPWVRCKIKYARPEDSYYQTIEVYAVGRAAMDEMDTRVGFVVETGGKAGVIPLARLTDTVIGVPWCREHPTRGVECRGEPWAGSSVRSAEQ